MTRSTTAPTVGGTDVPDRLDTTTAPVDVAYTISKLHTHGGALETFLGDLLGYWQREWEATYTDKANLLHSDTAALFEHDETVAGLRYVDDIERVGRNGRRVTPAKRFRFADQELAPRVAQDLTKVLFPLPGGRYAHATVSAVNVDSNEIDVLWNANAKEHGVLPTAVTRDDWFDPGPKVEAVARLGRQMLDPHGTDSAPPVALALLGKEHPRFADGAGPRKGVFTSDVEEITALVCQLDGSYLAVQGPPGTGKTYTGSHIIQGLLDAGLRVGITSFSHSAIDNLLEATVKLYASQGKEMPKMARRASAREDALPGVDYVANNRDAASTVFDLVAGTTWCFASDAMAENPVDVLLIDEAGQLSLADALSTTSAAHNLVLLGDPLQLPQVTKGEHPNGAGASVLEHILDGDATIQETHGVFLETTRRMHPDIATFLSERIYQGRLDHHPSCSDQSTAAGTGLRRLQVTHSGRSTSSIEEVERIRDELATLIGTPWTDQHGHQRTLVGADVMVVAPYNRQVELLADTFSDDDSLCEVQVGTVDKFQGREAPVVFYSMTSSTLEDGSRGIEFLFSQNRFNVAVSRARCLVYLVCTDDLLTVTPTSPTEERLVGHIQAFADAAGHPAAQPA